MSWSIFKQEMLSKMENSSFKSTDEFADFFTQKYDQCMKRGLDLVTGNTVIKGNTELMRSTILYALEVGKNSKTEAFYNQSIALLGKGAITYWTGAEWIACQWYDNGMFLEDESRKLDLILISHEKELA